MVGGIAGATPADNAEIAEWLHPKTPWWFRTFSVKEAAEAIGHEVLLQMAEAAEAGEHYLAAARLFGQLCLTAYGSSHWGSSVLGTPVTDDHPILQASRCWAKVGADTTAYVRAEELCHQVCCPSHCPVLLVVVVVCIELPSAHWVPCGMCVGHNRHRTAQYLTH
jgi:hypothetical protein